VGQDQARTEFFFLGLRLKEGVSKQDYHSLFSESFDDRYQKTVESLSREGLLTDADGRVALTQRGFLFADTVMASFE